MELTRVESKMVKLYENQRQLSELDRAKMIYGFRILVADFKKIIVVYGIAAILGCLIETIFIHLAFMFFRQVAFGIHSSSFMICLVISSIVLPSTAFLLQLWSIPQEIIWISYLVSTIILLLFAPIGSKMNTIRGSAHFHYLRKKMYLRLGVLCLILLLVPATFTKYLVAGLALESITILISLIKKE